VFNTIAMSYATMTVYQQIVLSDPQKAGGTFTFSVKAMDGGGRGPPNFPQDVANISMQFYNSSGTLIGTAASNNSTVFNTFNTYTVSTSDCGGAGCANVYFMRINMTGNDGGYWAGNAGTNFKEPTLTFAPTGGTATAPNLLYNPEFGVYGTYASTSAPHGWWNSTNAWGGNTHPQVLNNYGTVNAGNVGYLVQGGTLSGTVGGYPSTYYPGPTVVGGTITQTNAPSNQTLSSGGGASAGPTVSEVSRINNYNNSSKPYSNYLYIEQVAGDNNNVTITQDGGPNRIEATLNGVGSNTLNLTQNGANYLNVNVNGYNNSLTTNQSNTGGSHYVETTITGNTNTVNHTQTGNANQLLFSNINGNNNTVSSNQTGTAQHYLNVSLTGNNNSVLSDQSGNTSNSATINLTNNGGPASVDLQQSGGKTFNLIQSCVNPAGCSTVVRQ
jgi:hypothetical protein